MLLSAVSIMFIVQKFIKSGVVSSVTKFMLHCLLLLALRTDFKAPLIYFFYFGHWCITRYFKLHYIKK